VGVVVSKPEEGPATPLEEALEEALEEELEEEPCHDSTHNSNFVHDSENLG
jgi:hypothetical protein